MTSVLLADDQALVRAGFRMILEAHDDIDVVGEAGDGTEAIELARTHAPDVVLMDVRMPRLDGIAATRAIVSERPATRVLVLTTFDLDDYVYDAITAGASGFLLKDVGRDDLVAAVRVVASGDAMLAPTVTRRLLTDFVRSRPGPQLGASGDAIDQPHGARVGHLRAACPRAVQRADRREAGGQRAHREDARGQRSSSSSLCAIACMRSSTPTSTVSCDPPSSTRRSGRDERLLQLGHPQVLVLRAVEIELAVVAGRPVPVRVDPRASVWMVDMTLSIEPRCTIVAACSMSGRSTIAKSWSLADVGADRHCGVYEDTVAVGRVLVVRNRRTVGHHPRPMEAGT